MDNTYSICGGLGYHCIKLNSVNKKNNYMSDKLSLITELNDIDTSTSEGRLALAAISLLWVAGGSVTPTEVIDKCNDLTKRQFSNT